MADKQEQHKEMKAASISTGKREKLWRNKTEK